MLYALWRDLHATHPKDLLPLIFVGGICHASQPFVNLIRQTRRLYPHFLRYESEVSDAELQWLYANCRFTVFPSFYEGWGLPVIESMQHGKVCISADASSLPEAGSGLSVLIRPFDYYIWRETILRYLTDDLLLSQQEALIRKHFRPLDWDTCIDRFEKTMVAEFPSLGTRDKETAPCA